MPHEADAVARGEHYDFQMGDGPLGLLRKRSGIKRERDGVNVERGVALG
jgi:hypothetical protein